MDERTSKDLSREALAAQLASAMTLLSWVLDGVELGEDGKESIRDLASYLTESGREKFEKHYCLMARDYIG
jgi:hypothetical protein